MFCSIHCRNSANGKRTGGRNRLPRVSYTCEWCGSIFDRDANYAQRIMGDTGSVPRCCSLTCHNRLTAAENTSLGRVAGERNGVWANGRSPIYYRKFLTAACEWCGSTRFLLIHHADENRDNSAPSNLITLCKACHQRHHGEHRRDPVTGRYARIVRDPS